MGHLERAFDLRAHGTTVRREVGAGLVTFLTLSYILFVQPVVLGAAGMDPGGVLFATCIASALACFLMAWWTNYPIALAPAMGHNFYFAFFVCLGLGLSWQEALAANFMSGAMFLALSGCGLRERIMHALPPAVARGITVGIGMMIAMLGLQWGGIVVDHPSTLVTLGDLGSTVALTTILGLGVTSAMLACGFRSAILVGILVSTAIGLVAGSIEYGGLAGPPPDPAAAFQLDFGGLFARPTDVWIGVLVTFLILDLFDTAGTLIGVADRAGLLEGDRLPRARGAFAADASGTVAGCALGTSTVTSYVESAAGVAAGGRTGLTTVVVGACFLLALWFEPLVRMVGAGVVVATEPDVVVRYPVIAPVLVIVGVLMAGSARGIDWEDFRESIPAFLTIVIITFSISITDGIAWGVIAYSLLSIVSRRGASVSMWVHGLAVVFILRYACL